MRDFGRITTGSGIILLYQVLALGMIYAHRKYLRRTIAIVQRLTYVQKIYIFCKRIKLFT